MSDLEWPLAPLLPEAPVGAIGLIHGMSEHLGRYRRFAEALVAAGWAVYGHDFPGHGPEAEARDIMGDIGPEGWSGLVDHVGRLVEQMRAAHPGLPVGLFGHSMGSLVLQGYMTDRAARGADFVALSGTSGPPPALATLGRLVVRLERLRAGPGGKSLLIDGLSFGAYNRAFRPNRTDFDWLSRDPAEVDAYVSDPLCGAQASIRTWQEILDALPRLTKPAALARVPKHLPIYVLSGDADMVGDRGVGVNALVDRYRAAGLTEVEVHIYPEARHELLNESNRDEVTSDFLEWLKARGA